MFNTLSNDIKVTVKTFYYFRAVTMIVTNLPSADANYKCDPQLNTTLSGAQVQIRTTSNRGVYSDTLYI